MSIPLDPIPAQDPLVQRQVYMGDRWIRWISQLVAKLESSVLSISPAVHRTAVNAAISTTTLFTPTQAGDYRVSWYAQITTPAGVSSSVEVVIGWKSSGVACSRTFNPASLTGNTTASADGDAITIRPDAAQPVTYATNYASNPASAMAHLLDVVAESLT